MKKHTKKLLSLVLTFVMVLSMTATVFAETAKAVITVGTDDKRTYEVYQIFTGDLSGDVLSNVKWGANGTGTFESSVDDATLETLIDAKEISGVDEKLDVIKQYVNLNSDPVGTVNKDASLEVPTGYYLFKDITTPGQGEAYSLHVVEIVGPTTFSPKTGQVISYKKVDDKNDSNTTEDTVTWQDSADYDMGDMVPFQLTGTVPADYANYDAYYYSFHDTECEGLTFDEATVKVFVDGTEITEGFTVVTEDLKTGETFEVEFANLKDIVAVKANSVITVEYKSLLNTGANIGAAGNPNEMYVQYSNNPNSEWTPSWGNDDVDNDGDNAKDEEDEKEGPTGTTPKDKVIVFTYKAAVNKVDQDGKALPGAEFKLEKVLANGSKVELTLTKNAEGTVFTAVGLDDGNYVLTETVTPDGYNTIAPVEFTIGATHDIEAAEPKLLTLTGGDMFTGAIDTLTLTADVVNQAGTTLPETGGAGTTMIYVIGAVLVLGAGLVLVTKKRAA